MIVTDESDVRLRLGVNSCLLGEPVRYDGGHKRDRYILDTLGRYLEFVPVCPEVECGFSVPREAFRLVGDPAHPRMVTQRSGVDVTDRMERWARRRVKALEAEELCGFVFKSKSPSNGMERVKVWGAKGQPVNRGVGIFARIFMEHFPLLPVEEEGRLRDARLRENFIESIFTLWRWRQTLAQRKALRHLIEFHSRHKLLLLAHSPTHYRALGKLVGGGKGQPLGALYAAYQQGLLEALRIKATPGKNANVLRHMAGYFKKHLPPAEKAELSELIEQYRQQILPLIVPVTLIQHYARKYEVSYLLDQVYLDPHPIELKLRNHA